MRLWVLFFAFITSADYVPFQLLRPDTNHANLEINEEGLERLSNIYEPIAIIAAVGPYHSGKSFLLNALRNQTTGFRVGPTVNPETHGLWLLETNFSISGAKILFMDTEGFSGREATESYDAKVFVVSSLLSSHVIFNSDRIVDQATVDYLELLSRRAHLFSLVSYLSSFNDASTTTPVQDDPGFAFPHLSFVVQKFWQNLGGLSPQEWLAQYLDNQKRDPNFSSADRGLEKVFTGGISCHTVFLPATDEKSLSDLSQIEFSDLTIKFRENIEKLKTHMFQKLEFKKNPEDSTGQSILNGHGFSSLIRFYVNSANRQTFPKVPSLWKTWMADQLQTAKMDAIRYYDDQLNAYRQQEIPFNAEDYESKHYETKQRAVNIFRHLLFDVKSMYQMFEAQLTQLLDESYYFHRNENHELVNRYVKNITSRGEEILLNELERVALLLPIPVEEIEMKIQNLRHSFQNHAEVTLAKFQHLDIYKDEYKRIRNVLDTRKAKIIDENKLKIQTLLHSANDNANNKYHASMVARTTTKLTSYDLRLKHTESKQEAWIAFDAIFLENEWITKGELYKGQKKETGKDIRTTFTNHYMKENDKKVQVFIQTIKNRINSDVRSKIQYLPLPLAHEELVQRLDKLLQSKLEEYETELKSYQDISGFEAAKVVLQKDLADMVKVQEQENTKSLANSMRSILECAKNVINQDCTFPLCLRGYSQSHLGRDFKRSVKECADKSTAGSVSERSQDVVVQLWISKELSEPNRVIITNRSSLFFISLVAGFSIALVFLFLVLIMFRLKKTDWAQKPMVKKFLESLYFKALIHLLLGWLLGYSFLCLIEL